MPVSQLPAPLDVECIAGDPFSIQITASGATVTAPTFTLLDASGTPVAVAPAVSAVANVITVAFSGTQTAALPRSCTWSLAATVNGQGPFQLLARKLTVWPVGTAGVSTATAATLAVTVGGAAVSLAVALGGSGLQAANNLSDLANAGTARTNLGLGSAAVQAASAFATAAQGATADAAAARAANLSDLTNVATARSNLGLGSAATAAATAFAPAQNLATHIYRPGGYGSFPFGVGWAGSPAQFSNGLLVFVPVVSPVTGTWDRIGIEVVTTAGSAGSVHRLGMWANNAGVPDTLITDFGTVATDTVGLKEITIAQSVTAGVVYWLGVAQQGAPATTAALRVAFANFQGLVTTNPNFNQFGLQSSGNTGAFASAPSIAAGSQSTGAPRIFVRFT